MNARLNAMLLVGLTLTACGVKKDRFGRTAEPSSLPEPLTLKEISFHVRMRSPESDVVAQAAKRGLFIEGDPQQELAAIHAPPSLIAQLATTDILLTKAERKLCADRLAARGSLVATEQQHAEAFLDDRKAALNQSLADQRRARIKQRMNELTENMRKLRKEQERERYSTSGNTPYQIKAKEIDQLGREYSALQEQLK